MAFVFVQVWGHLPTIHEVFMGDVPLHRQPSGEFTGAPQGTRPPFSPGRNPYSENENRTGQSAPSAPSPQPGYPPMQSYSPQQHMQHARPENFNMSALGNALPDLAYQGYGHVPPQRYPQGLAPPGVLYQVQNVSPYSSAPSISPSSATFNMQYQGQYQGMYGSGGPAQHLQPGTAGGQFYPPNQGFVGHQQQQGSPYLVQPNQYGVQGQMYTGGPSQYGMRASFSGESRHGQQRSAEFLGASTVGHAGRSNSTGE